jgi:hypothetical protein
VWPVFRVLAVVSTEFALSGALIERSPARLRKYNHCGGSLKIAAIEDPPVIIRILTHLGLPTNQFALASIPIYVVSILPIYLHSTFA